MDAQTRAIRRLQEQGILCYLPGVQAGPCRAPYAVVRGGGSYARGTSGGAGVGYGIVTVYCFVPRVSGDLPALAARVREAMRALRDQLAPTGNEGPEMLEPDYDARSMTIEYRVLKASRPSQP